MLRVEGLGDVLGRLPGVEERLRQVPDIPAWHEWLNGRWTNLPFDRQLSVDAVTVPVDDPTKEKANDALLVFTREPVPQKVETTGDPLQVLHFLQGERRRRDRLRAARFEPVQIFERGVPLARQSIPDVSIRGGRALASLLRHAGALLHLSSSRRCCSA